MLRISWNINSLKNKFGEVKGLIESYKPDFLCLQKIRLNKGLEYHMAYSPAPTDLVLVGYFKTEQWEQIVTNRLYYVPAAPRTAITPGNSFSPFSFAFFVFITTFVI